MPDLVTRGKHEKALAGVLLLLFGDEYDRLRGGLPFSMAGLAKRIEPELITPLEQTYVQAGGQLLGRFQVDRSIEIPARTWAERYSKRLAKELAESTRDKIADLEGSDPNFDESLAELFAGGRAETIGITETTRAISAGEDGAARIIDRVTGKVLLTTWFTERDGRVCPICEPLHGTTARVWGLRYPGGPPAHPRCRCWKEYQ